MIDIRRGDRVVRTDFLEKPGDITTHPGVPGTVDQVKPSNSAEPDFAEVTFRLGDLTYYRMVRVDKLRKVN